MADELELVPTLAIAFSGCDLRCAFCITGEPSWNPRAGQLMDPAALAARGAAALAAGARSIMFLGGEATIHLHYLLEVVGHLPDTARLVFKTNGHGAEISRRLLHGLFEVWCVDYKFGNDACADRLAQVPDYVRVMRENLVWAAGQGDLIVRHVIMPGHVECCWRPVAQWLAAELPQAKVNLRSGFWPAWQARRHAELTGTVTAAEVREARAIAAACALRLVV
jgi:putative pyruvate formate lyase activating enzyme